MLTLHEVMHVLGFSYVSMGYWIDKSTGKTYGLFNIGKVALTENIRGLPTKIISSDKVKATARKYYGCDSLTGMQFENEVIFTKILFLRFSFKIEFV